MFRAALKSLLGRKVRLLMSTFAIVIGVSFVVGTLVFSDTLSRSSIAAPLSRGSHSAAPTFPACSSPMSHMLRLCHSMRCGAGIVTR